MSTKSSLPPVPSPSARSSPTQPVGYVVSFEVGQSWRAEFKKKMWLWGTTIHGTFRLDYTVVDVDAAGSATVRISDPPGEREPPTKHEVVFDRSSRLVSISEEMFLTIPDTGPHLQEYDDGREVLFVWPDFPLAASETPRLFGPLEQVVHERDSTFDIVVAHRDIPGRPVRWRRAELTWEKGRPWWSTLVIRGFYDGTGGGVPYERTEVEARVIDWSLNPERGEK